MCAYYFRYVYVRVLLLHKKTNAQLCIRTKAVHNSMSAQYALTFLRGNVHKLCLLNNQDRCMCTRVCSTAQALLRVSMYVISNPCNYPSKSGCICIDCVLSMLKTQEQIASNSTSNTNVGGKCCLYIPSC